MEIKIHECSICRRLFNAGIKGEERFMGTRKQVRNHLTEVHRIKGRKNRQNLNKKDFGPSNISVETRSTIFK